MRTRLILIVPALIAGCNSAPTVTATNASVKAVNDKVAAAGGNMGMGAGRWEGTVTVRNVKAATAHSELGNDVLNSQVLTICVTPAQAESGANPFVAGIQASCTYDSFKLAGGQLDATMTCRQQGITLKTQMKGEISADTYQLTNVTEASGQVAAAKAGIKLQTDIDARRTGDCRGDEARPRGPST